MCQKPFVLFNYELRWLTEVSISLSGYRTSPRKGFEEAAKKAEESPKAARTPKLAQETPKPAAKTPQKAGKSPKTPKTAEKSPKTVQKVDKSPKKANQTPKLSPKAKTPKVVTKTPKFVATKTPRSVVKSAKKPTTLWSEVVKRNAMNSLKKTKANQAARVVQNFQKKQQQQRPLPQFRMVSIFLFLLIDLTCYFKVMQPPPY